MDIISGDDYFFIVLTRASNAYTMESFANTSRWQVDRVTMYIKAYIAVPPIINACGWFSWAEGTLPSQHYNMQHIEDAIARGVATRSSLISSIAAPGITGYDFLSLAPSAGARTMHTFSSLDRAGRDYYELAITIKNSPNAGLIFVDVARAAQVDLLLRWMVTGPLNEIQLNNPWSSMQFII